MHFPLYGALEVLIPSTVLHLTAWSARPPAAPQIPFTPSSWQRDERQRRRRLPGSWYRLYYHLELPDCCRPISAVTAVLAFHSRRPPTQSGTIVLSRIIDDLVQYRPDPAPSERPFYISVPSKQPRYVRSIENVVSASCGRLPDFLLLAIAVTRETEHVGYDGLTLTVAIVHARKNNWPYKGEPSSLGSSCQTPLEATSQCPKVSKRTRPIAPTGVDAASSPAEHITPPLDAITTLPAGILLEIFSYFRSIPITHFPIDSSTDFHLPVDTALEHLPAFAYLIPPSALGKTSRWLESGRGQAHGINSATMHLWPARQNITAALEALAKGIQACPNLRTLCLWFASASTVKAIRAAGLDKHTFPSVEKVVGPDPASLFLPCCPNVRGIIGPTNATPLVKAMQTTCKSVEILANFSGGTAILKKLVKLAPNLREIWFHSSPRAEDCEVLRAFKPCGWLK
ncbi:hypothetical protein FA13DRAFT_1862045 [Coprinellus micaceus]|uniref:Uncharacterized protein n=1 Tax=Coprinellus micaceus TaxID=71717 RepID=A0A4Y7T631_COPMI|nr:hypothetical protein FA13DRAFT_1862045 [Coprinellus micaceus]